MDDFCVITFPSTHMALKFEREAKDYKLNTKLIPVPRQISSSCGLAGKISEKDIQNAQKLCSEKGIEFQHFYKVFRDKTKQPELLK